MTDLTDLETNAHDAWFRPNDATDAAEIPILNASKAPETEHYVMECTLTMERTETLGDATTERRAELNGYLSKEVLESALDIMQKVVGE